ncbi:hypothetical protein NP233_g1906 [Leucocoprinus birnbaumii]|uniref:F-box domain-containing protein n=1 Tax=Leucocoprinus birnbaumii TaxID=56174 RepID=A0AAD5YXL9_9AGAR|nr:hypothetical protein NP233_g1906 [Leucocoprinus birnbaumii]
MTTYLYPHNLNNTTHFRDRGDDAMDVESSSGESIISSARSQTLSGTGSPTPGRQMPFLPSFSARSGSAPASIISNDGQPVEQITTLLTCGHCSHDVVLSGPVLTSKLLLVPSTPVPHLLYTNSSPSTASEGSEIQSYIQQTNKAIAQLNWEIGRTNAILEMLVLEREKLVDLVEEHKALLSPWRRMPTDILGHIFRKCEKGAISPSTSSDACVPEVPDPFEPTSGPLLLSQVCKQWRTQALHMPELWSNIRIRIGRGELQESRRLPLIHAWLERSANHPLTVCMVERSPRSPVYTSDSRNLAVGMLLGTARRWKRLYLALHSQTPHWGLFANLKAGHIPLLEHCTIVTPREDTNISADAAHPPDVLINLLAGAASLRELRLDFNVTILGLQFPRKSITSLDLYTITKDRSIPVSMVFETLYHCPSLRSLKVRCHVAGPFAPPSSLYHINLRSLAISIDTDSGPGAESLLAHLTPPNLTHLTLYTPETEWDQDSMMGFIARCGEVKEFRVKCKNLENRWLLEMLKCERMRGVEDLALDLGLGVTNDLLADLSIPTPSSPDSPQPAHQLQVLAPKLKSFEIGGRLFISPDDFLALISSRRYPSPPNACGVEVLEEVVVDCEALVYGFMSPFLVEQLDELRWWGLRLSVWEGGKLYTPLLSEVSLSVGVIYLLFCLWEFAVI